MSKSKAVSELSLNKQQLKIDLVKSKQAAMVLRALNNPLRQKIIKVIDSKKQTDVTSLYNKLGIEQSVASQHLAILRRANIVVTERDGKHIYYSLNTEKIASVIAVVDKMLG